MFERPLSEDSQPSRPFPPRTAPSSPYPISLPLGSDTSLGTLSHPTPAIWELEMHKGEESLLDTFFLHHVLGKALDIVEKDWRSRTKAPGALIIIGNKNQDKYFCNGLHFASVSKDPGFFHNEFNPFLIRLLSFPIPTIAAMNGDTMAAGFFLALGHDYRVMTAGKARACLSEVTYGVPLPASITSLLNYKLPSAAAVRKTALEGHRWTPQELLEIGFIDEITDGGADGVLRTARALAEKKAPLAKTGVWGLIKKDLMRDVIDTAKKNIRAVWPAEEAAFALSRL